MKKEITVEEIVTEVTLMLSNTFISEMQQTGKVALTQQEVLDLYVSALHKTASAYRTESSNKSHLH